MPWHLMEGHIMPFASRTITMLAVVGGMFLGNAVNLTLGQPRPASATAPAERSTERDVCATTLGDMDSDYDVDLF